VFDIEPRGSDSNTLESLGLEDGIDRLLEADRCCGIQWNFQWVLPQRVDWKANTTVATGAAAAGVQYTWRSSTVESIDRSTTVGLEDGSVSASNGGKPNRRLEVVSFTLKDSFQWNRGRFLAIFQLVIIAYIDFVEFYRIVDADSNFF